EGRWLTGWKEIASYLGVHVKTAQRYAKELGMPVYSVGYIKARTDEIDAWIMGRKKYGKED
ncbi:MAG: hypothetical protein D6713_00960, partial [Deltaproteobacteria bacterium]